MPVQSTHAGKHLEWEHSAHPPLCGLRHSNAHFCNVQNPSVTQQVAHSGLSPTLRSILKRAHARRSVDAMHEINADCIPAFAEAGTSLKSLISVPLQPPRLGSVRLVVGPHSEGPSADSARTRKGYGTAGSSRRGCSGAGSGNSRRSRFGCEPLYMMAHPIFCIHQSMAWTS
eukprot:scaffold21491_cov37-Tisochrysis_lutea.AAC.2